VTTELAAEIPFFNEYLGPWAIEERAGMGLVHLAGGLNLRLHMEAHAPEFVAKVQTAKADMGDSRSYAFSGGIATIAITGPMQKQASSFSGGCSTVYVRRQLRAARSDAECTGVLIVVDSPGGTVSGNQELCDEIAALAREKPVFVQVEDMCCSAAFGASSQATKIFANRNSQVGSIGTYMVIYDLSKMAEKEGIKVHVLKAGAFKGAGTPGTEITKDQLDHFQKTIDGLNEDFIQTVARGRKMPQKTVREIADGRAHLPDDALKLGLIDGVQSREETIDQLRRARKPVGRAAPSNPKAAAPQGARRMTLETESQAAAPVVAGPATYEELKASCPKADPAFLCSQLERKATAEESRKAWAETLHDRLAASQAENDRLKAAAKAKEEEEGDDEDKEEKCDDEDMKAKKSKKAKATARPGVKPLADKGAGASVSDPKAEYETLIQEQIKLGRKRDHAARIVANAHPDLRQAMIDQVTEERKG
jgi:signal peptide peptidase SppA